MSEDETARVSLTRMVILDQADSFRMGWKEMVMIELDQMRSEMPYADTLVLSLETLRRPD